MSETMTAVRVEDLSPVKKKLSFDVPWVDVQKEMDAVYREVNKTAKVKGFRKGKVPRNILESLYKDYVEGETVAKLVERLYVEALKENDVCAVTQPEIEQQGLEKDKDFTFTATVEVEPVVEPSRYTGLVLEKVEREVAEKDVEGKLEEYRQMFATMEEIQEERAVREGDFITMDFSGTVDGVSRKELTAEGFPLEVGSKRFIPGFEEQLIGLARGATQDLNVRFPDDYYLKEIAGKDAVFTVTVQAIKEKKVPSLDETFIKNFDGFNSLEDLKEDIRQKMLAQNNVRAQNELREQMISMLLNENEFLVPDCYVEREYRYMLADVQRRMAMDGLSKEQAGEFQKQFQDQYRQGALRTVKTATLLNSIAQKEGVAVTEGELEERIEEIARQSRDYERTKQYLQGEALKANLNQELLHNKVLKFIEDNAEIKIVQEEKDVKGEDTVI